MINLTLAIRQSFADYTDLNLPESIVTEINVAIQDEDFVQYYHEASTDFDTADRDFVFDMIAHKITGKSWPCYGDSAEYSISFWNEIREKCNEVKDVT